MDRRILVTGVTSIHGWPVWQKLGGKFGPGALLGVRPPKMSVPDEKNVLSACITDQTVFESIRKEFRPTDVVHCAGVCDLDVCEQRPQWAYRLNVVGTRVLARVFGSSCHMYQMSTDLVFSGNTPPPSGYCEHCLPDPVSVAGKTFAEAERITMHTPRWCVVRLGLPLGPSVTGKKGAVDWVAQRLRKGLPISLFYDERRSCISTEELSIFVVSAIERKLRGLYHLGGSNTLSLYEMGKRVLVEGGWSEDLLNGLYRAEEINGPPRIGNVELNSERIRATLKELNASR